MYSRPEQPSYAPPLSAKRKAAHLEEQHRRMRCLRAAAWHAEETNNTAASAAAADKEETDNADEKAEEKAEEKAVLDQGDDDQVDQGEPLAEEAEGIANDLTAVEVMQFIEVDGGMRLDQRMLLTRLLCNSCALKGVWAIPDDDI